MKKVYNVLYNLVLVGIIFGFSLQMYFVYLNVTNQREIANKVATKISKQPW